MTALLFAAWLSAQPYKGLGMDVEGMQLAFTGSETHYYRLKVLRTCPEGMRLVVRPDTLPEINVGEWVTLKVECDPERPR